MLHFCKYLALLSLLSCIALSAGAEVKNESSQNHVETNQWSFDIAAGYAAIENPLKHRSSAETHVLPQWHYYGDNFYIDNVTLGYSLFESDSFYIDLYSYLNDDGIFYNSDNNDLTFLDVRKFTSTRPSIIRHEIPKIKRELSYMGGIQAFWDIGYVELKLTYGKDITAGNHGNELSFSLFDNYYFENLNILWELGVTYKDETLVNYYYQFTEEEVFGKMPPLTKKWSGNPYARFSLAYRLSENWSAIISINKHWLHDDITKSMLVESKSYLSGFVGFNYHF